ncbi:uncharacterized protein LOC129938517 isoform X2 [Eupeodes corollae]|nr:uncharacterized protein LOC129938517 isoform X2 [Eupeodes corollae]
MSWRLPPNRYDIPNEMGSNKNGVEWSRSTGNAKRKKHLKQNNQTKFYEISTSWFEKSKNKCNRHKGKFTTGSDPRIRRPSTRFMISNYVTCWRDKSDPGPSNYFVGIFDQKRFKKTGPKKQILHSKFYRNSCVPESSRFQVLGNPSFSPGPGRYELFDDEEFLRVRLQTQTQKLQRFRRLNFKNKISQRKTKSHCVQRHIFGSGFTRLFKGSSKILKKVNLTKKHHHKTGREIRMFPSFDYIKLITDPERESLCTRTEEFPDTSVEKPLKFNCLLKVRKRRQLRDNKKVVFGSGMPRFKDFPTPLIVQNQAKPLPLFDWPTMRVDPTEIKSKLNALPERLKEIEKSPRIRPFKFQPLPPVKLLLEEKEIYLELEKLFDSHSIELSPTDFLKNDSN